MAPASLSSLARTCIWCLSSIEPSKLLPQTQRVFRSTRSKKQIFLVAQLKQPYPLWGPQGTFVRVTPGFMRNVLYPRKIARYVVGEELKKLLQSEIPIQRDRSFMDPTAVEEDDNSLLSEWKATSSAASSTKPSITVPTISPERTLALLESLGQPKYIFHRRVNPSASDLTSEGEQKGNIWHAGTPIFGSVSTAEIAQTIKESVAHNDEASAIILGPTNIRIISGQSEDADSSRLKALGSYMVEISLGKDLVFTRMVEVRPENDVLQTELGKQDGVAIESKRTA